ncbi:MAG TPA: hypothetical protein VHE34_16260 [Puia sp.]|nr:MAG: hypothetical protein BGO55_02790 [Sphingobacteriales bacterium 50-39]HVU96784.1 hypothetical protein [Puia sp.]
MEQFLFYFDLAAELVFRWKDQAVSGSEKLTVFFKYAVFDEGLILVGTKDDADSGVITGNLLQVFEDSNIHIKLAYVLMR